MNHQSEAWKEWSESEIGKDCAAGIAQGRYLTNRLWSAFMAGYEAADESQTQSDDKASAPQALEQIAALDHEQSENGFWIFSTDATKIALAALKAKEQSPRG